MDIDTGIAHIGPDPRRPALLIVEDEFLVAIDLAGFLEQLGIEAVVATHVDEAIDRLADSGPFDAALLDVNLAGTRSWTVARELRRRAVPFAFVTGYEADHADIPEDLRGAPVWPKPIELDRLRSCIVQMGLLKAATARSALEPASGS